MALIGDLLGAESAGAAASDSGLDPAGMSHVGLPLSPWFIAGFLVVLVAATWRVLQRVRRLLPRDVEPKRAKITTVRSSALRSGLTRLAAFARPRVKEGRSGTNPDLPAPALPGLPAESNRTASGPASLPMDPPAPAPVPVVAKEPGEEPVSAVLSFAPRRRRVPPDVGQERPAPCKAAVVQPAAEADLVVVLSVSETHSCGPAAQVLARQLAEGGRTILLDVEGYCPAAGGQGLAELVRGELGFADAIQREEGSRLHFIPGGETGSMPAEGLDLVIEALCATYEFVVIGAGDAAGPLAAALAGRARFGLVLGQDHAAREDVAVARSLFPPGCEILVTPAVSGLRSEAA